MTPLFELKRIDIFTGWDHDTPEVERWYVNHIYTDGSGSIVDSKLTYEDACGSAVYGAMEDGVFNTPIHKV